MQNKSKQALKKPMRPQSQRLALEPRIVFDAALPIAAADFIDATHAPVEALADASTHIDAPADHSTNAAAVFANNETDKAAVDSKSTLTDIKTIADAAPTERALIEGTLAPVNLTSHEIIFIDAIVSDLQQYISDHPNADVVLLDSTKDALDQIAAVLNGRTDISAIHILSHGASGMLEIGNGILSLDNLSAGSHAADLYIIKSAMAENGDILIYGCNVASGNAGQAFIDALAKATGADIAASLDSTGAANLGGNWNLETSTATIDAKALDLAAWNGDLAFTNTATGGAWSISAAANTATVPVTATNTTDGITTTVTLASGTANAWSATAVQTLNNIAAFSNGAQNTADFTTTFAGGVTGTVTITFSKAVINPIIHIDRIGGITTTPTGPSNSSVWTLATAGASLTKLTGSSSLAVTSTTFQRTTGVTTTGTESSLTDANGTAAGSIQVTGTYTTLTFNVTGAADGIELAFAIDAPPVTNNDAFTINEDTTLTGNLFANNGSGADVDARGDIFKVNTINGTTFTVGTPITLANGILTITDATTGAFTFVPNANYNGVQTFTYDVKEINTTGTPLPGTGVGNVSNTSTATITVASVNDAPIAKDDVFNVKQGASVVGELFESNGNGVDSDIDGGTLNLTKVNGAAFTVGTPIVLSNGTLTILNAATGMFNFVANPNAVGTQAFTYEVGDGQGGFTTANVNISLYNNAPTVSLNGASSLLVNGSFENSVQPNTNANNYPATNVGWTSTGGNQMNVIRVNGSAGGVYVQGPEAAADGMQYLDIGTNTDTVSQIFTLASATNISFGAEFANRDVATGFYVPATGKIEILNSVGTVVATSSVVSLTAAQGAASWYASNGTASLAAGTYTYRVSMTDYMHVDNAFVHAAPNNYTTAYIENAAPTPIASLTAGIADIDDSKMESATITLTNFKAGDSLSVIGTLPTGIVASAYNALTGVITLTGSATKAAYATALNQIGFANSTETPDTTNRIVNVTVNDGQINSNTAVTTITVTAVNDAPINVMPVAQTTLEDTTIVFSTANGNAIQISDVDAGSGLVTVTIWADNGLLTLASTTGLTFSTNSDYSVASTGTNEATIRVTGTLANINAALNGLIFKPTANTNGGAATGPGTGVGKISIRTEDNGNTGTGGNLTDTDSVTINITAVKDTTVDNVTTNEDTPIVISPYANDSFGVGNVFLTGVTTPSHGTSVVNAGAGTTTYTPTANYNGTDSYTYTTTTIDAGFKYEFWTDNQPNGSTYASVFTGGFPTRAADATGWTASISGADGIRIQEQQNDLVDNDVTARWSGVVLIEKTGTYTFSLVADNAARLLIDGTIVVTAAWPDGTLTGTLALTAGLHTFQLQYADTDVNQNVVLSYSGLDTGGATVNVNNDKHWGAAARTETETINITVNNVNDAPSGTNKTINIVEDTPYTVTAADFGFSDIVDLTPNAFANVIVISRPPAADGIYKLNGVAITTGQVITVVDINAGKLTFNPTLNKNGTTIGALGFKVQDNGGTANGGIDTDPVAKTLDFNIAAVNDVPTVSLPASLSTIEDTPLILNAIAIADVDATTGSETITVTIGAGQGVLNWTTTPFVSVTNNGTGSITLSGQISAIRNAITLNDALRYTPTPDFNGTATLTVTINDNGNTGTGGALSATASTTITVTPVADVVNDAVTTNEDVPITFNLLTGTNGASADNFENVTAAVTATSMPAHGSVTFNAAGSLVYTPTAGYSGTDTFTYTVTSGGVTETATVTVTINNVNDAPTAVDKTITILEDTPRVVTVADFGFADANDTPANAFINVIIGSTLPPVTEGVYTLNGVAIAPNQVISVADIAAGKLAFTPAANVNSPLPANTLGAISFQVQDNGGAANGGVDTSATQTLNFSVTPVDDVVTITGLNNGTVAGTDAQVKESDLSAGSNPTGTAETATGTFNLGPTSALSTTTPPTIGGVTVATGANIIGTNGTLTITNYNPATGVVTYSYTLTSVANHTGNITVNDSFAIVATELKTKW
jgi:large repetitive protein